MGLKFVIQPDHLPVNNFVLTVVGLPPITFTKVGGLSLELESVDLPDKTQASTGRTKAGETEVEVPSHHLAEIAAMDAWYREGRDPVSPTYKKVATLTNYSGTTLIQKIITLIGVFVSKSGSPDMDMDDDGKMSVMKYTLKWDDLIGVG